MRRGGQDVNAETHITNLIYRYAELLDAGDMERVRELLQHADITASGSDAKMRASELFPDLATSPLRGSEGAPPRRGKHVTTNVRVDVDGSGATAHARSTYLLVAEREGGPGISIVTAGQYHDDFELVEGAWRFSRRCYIQELSPLAT
jgi:3-phenylpropionate/cinnamic acid dioxygenase small subunit